MGLKKLFLLSYMVAFVFIGLTLLVDTGLAEFASNQTQDEGIASAIFVESDVRLIHTLQGERADAADNYGWVGVNLRNLNDDGSAEFLVSAPTYSDTLLNQGRVYLYIWQRRIRAPHCYQPSVRDIHRLQRHKRW
ncbi:MAG: hypothetical protein GFH27_549291n122 [Chloroflexi bacterium AL-W]|nr:hypothetical protein [Chloroflexi bacterium AL-N1]NOK67411.1 hypothetical protein [Chloroflexi bacterium AL-N10]NOK75097.1 hypothetical protein [Chloroflexi bacterium AL-N5]NOK81884.1 hypothetical protein [Chloroflexi bacterium AL-W]NOK89730.1 hypothetical protein [Chloroflexi bacterium AL-N15]